MPDTKKSKTPPESSGFRPKKFPERPRRDWLKYEVVEGRVFGRGANFRSLVSHRMDAGWKLWGDPFFYRVGCDLFGVQVLVDLQGLTERDQLSGQNEQDTGPVRLPPDLPPTQVAAKEAASELLHSVRSFRARGIKMHP